jgi:uncharacterized protein YdbL (DUF1318 family)
MIRSKALRRAFACAALYCCGAVIALPGDGLAQKGTQPAAVEAPRGSDAEQAALHRLALKYVGLKDLTGARRAAAQKAYDAEKESFLKSYDPTYARDKAAYQAAADAYETKRTAVWQSALDELKAQGYEFNGTKLEGEDLRYKKRPVEEDLARSSAPAQGEPSEGYLAIVNKYVQSNAEIEDLGARRLQAYKALAAHQDALIEKIDAEVPAASQEAAQPAPAKTAPLEAPKPPAKGPTKPRAEAPAKPGVEAPANPGAVEPTQPLVEAPAKPPAQATEKPLAPEEAKPPVAAPSKPSAEEAAKPSAEERGQPPRAPELRMGEERPTPPAPRQNAAAGTGAPVAPPPPQAEAPLREEAAREVVETPAPEARAAKTSAGAPAALPALPRLPREPGLPALPEAPTLPEEESAATPALAVAPLVVAAPEAVQLRVGVFGDVTWARPNLSWSSPWGAGAPFAVSPSLNRGFGGGGAEIALRLRPFDAAWGATGLQHLALGLALDVGGRAGSAQAGLAPFVSSGFSSRLQATQRVEVGYDIDVGGITVVTPVVTAGFSEAQFAVSNYGNVSGSFAWGSASDFELGATYGGGLELKVLGAATMQILYLRHEYNHATTAIWGGAVGAVFVGARKGLVENELRVGLVMPVPRLW